MVSRATAKKGSIKYGFFFRAAFVMTMVLRIDADTLHGGEFVITEESSLAESSNLTVSVNITVLENAVAKGAVCLDGSPPAYHLDRGYGSGANSWLVFMEGGGWCNDTPSCSDRALSALGSSLYMGNSIAFTGILSDVQSKNPDFYCWNRVMVRYCDGSSFTGDVEEVEPGSQLHLRGHRIWQAAIEDLLTQGMDKAEQCFFPQYLLEFIKPPLFVVNSAYDTTQVANIWVPVSADPDGDWENCKRNITTCAPWQLEIMEGFRDDTICALTPVSDSCNGGLFINSCYAHCQTNVQKLWHTPSSPKLNSKTIAEAVGDWFFNRNVVKYIGSDSPYLCGSTSYNFHF